MEIVSKTKLVVFGYRDRRAQWIIAQAINRIDLKCEITKFAQKRNSEQSVVEVYSELWYVFVQTITLHIIIHLNIIKVLNVESWSV